MTRRLDWVSQHDDRSLLFGVAPLIEQPSPRQSVLWEPGQVLDQGEEGACVPHGFLGEALAQPVPVDFTTLLLPNGWSNDPQRLAFQLYDWCRQNDGIPGDDTTGTSVLAGAKALQTIGLITEYRWAFGLAQVLDALCSLGPVVLGVPWFSGMYEAPGGHLQVTGDLVGGHCLLAIGYDPAHVFPDGTVAEAVALLNSWGPSYGINGVAWIKAEDLGRLLEQRAEACVPLVRLAGPQQPPAPQAEPVRGLARFFPCMRRQR